MSASALHATAQDMVDSANHRRLLHKYEVPMRKETVLCLDANQRPLGNASCGPGPMQKYELRSQPTVFSFYHTTFGEKLFDGRTYKEGTRTDARMYACIDRKR